MIRRKEHSFEFYKQRIKAAERPYTKNMILHDAEQSGDITPMECLKLRLIAYPHIEQLKHGGKREKTNY